MDQVTADPALDLAVAYLRGSPGEPTRGWCSLDSLARGWLRSPPDRQGRATEFWAESDSRSGYAGHGQGERVGPKSAFVAGHEENRVTIWRPDRECVEHLVICELDNVATVGVHQEDVKTVATIRDKDKPRAVGRPLRNVALAQIRDDAAGRVENADADHVSPDL